MKQVLVTAKYGMGGVDVDKETNTVYWVADFCSTPHLLDNMRFEQRIEPIIEEEESFMIIPFSISVLYRRVLIEMAGVKSLLSCKLLGGRCVKWM